ncbi:nucleolar protein [Stagonosporopsis vannaccii]|nr:nucleolar protein [Stagonosporopsis vannaccii]
MSSMFDLPSAKRVRRDELRSPDESPRSTPDRDVQDFLRQRLSAEYAFTTTEREPDHGDVQEAAQSDEDEAELRLFAAPANAAPATLKVRLTSPALDQGDGSGFLRKKPKSYYFADEPTSDEELALHASAIDGSAVLELSRQPWPACAVPWKVRTLTKDGIKKAVLVGHPPTLATVEEKESKRTRKGKKARIALRKKKQANKDKQEEKLKLAAEKEAAEREKRTRRNREKKVKKKAKAQAKKAGGEESAESGTHPAVEADADTSMQD